MGLEHGRVRLEWVSAAEGEKFQRVVTEFTEQIRALGPLGWGKQFHDECRRRGRDEAAKEAVPA